MNPVASFLVQARAHPLRTAIIGPDLWPCSYGSLAVMIQDHAMLLSRRGVKPGTRVLLTAPVDIGYYACLAAILSLGAVVVLPDPEMGFCGVRHAAEAARPDVWIAPPHRRLLGQFFPATRRIPFGLSVPRLPISAGEIYLALDDAIPSDDAPALISFTSGSTGKPKGIVRSHALLAEQARRLEPLLRPREGDVDLVAFPVFVLALLGLGATCALPNWSLTKPRSSDAVTVLSRAAESRTTRLLLPPSICEKIVDDYQFPRAVRSVLTGGGTVYPDLLRRLGERVPEAVAVYGSTEAEAIAHVAASEIPQEDWTEMAAGGGILAGLPVPQARVRIVADELQVSGPHVNKGYLDPFQDASTKVRDGDGTVWHRTGDAGRLDAKGRLWLLGRLDGRVGGLFPFCIEVAARAWPGVACAALCRDSQGNATLVLSGDPTHAGEWSRLAVAIGVDRILPAARIPMDRRHGSKPDYAALRRIVG